MTPVKAIFQVGSRSRSANQEGTSLGPGQLPPQKVQCPRGSAQHKAGTGEGSCRCCRGRGGLDPAPAAPHGGGRFLLHHHPRPHRRRRPSESCSAPHTGISLEVGGTGARGWRSAQGLSWTQGPSSRPDRTKPQGACLPVSPMQQTLCGQTTVYPGFPGRVPPSVAAGDTEEWLPGRPVRARGWWRQAGRPHPLSSARLVSPARPTASGAEGGSSEARPCAQFACALQSVPSQTARPSHLPPPSWPANHSLAVGVA